MCRLLTAAGRNVSGTLRKSVSNTEYAYRIRFFECVVDETQFVLLRERLKKEIAAEQDSLSFIGLVIIIRMRKYQYSRIP